MASLLPLAHVRLLAAGTLPDRPLSRPVVSPLDGSCAGRLNTWRRLQALSDQAHIVTQYFERDEQTTALPGTNLHAARLRKDWGRLCHAVDTPMLVYLHRGHQSETHSPILQHLLHLLDYCGPVHALRVENREAFLDAMIMARALAAKSGLALVLRDSTERLTAAQSRPRPMRFALLGTQLTERRPVSLPERTDPSVSFFKKRF